MSPVISSVCSRLVGTFGSSRRASSCAAIGLFVEAAVAAGVDEPREQLRIVAVAVGLAQQAHERRLRLAHVRLEVRVELVRHRKPRVELEGAAEGLLGARVAVGRASMNLPITRWQRPRCAQAGAKLGSSSRQRWYRSRACGSPS